MTESKTYETPFDMAKDALETGSMERVNQALERINQMSLDLKMTAADHLNLIAHMAAVMGSECTNQAGFFAGLGMMIQAKFNDIVRRAATLHTTPPSTAMN